MNGRPDEEVRELLGAYALDAVDDIERRAVERLAERDEDAAREIRSLRATVALISAAESVAPPAGLRDSVLAEIARTPQEAPAGPGTARAGREGRAARTLRARRRDSRPTHPVLLGAVAAAAVAVLAIPGVVAWQATERAARAEAQAELLTDVLADPSAEVVRGDVAGGGEAVAVLAEDRAVLVASGLPALDEERVYQLWTLRDGGAVPAGLLEVDDGSVRALAEGYRPGDGLAVSVEPAGGSEQPTTEPVVVLQPS